MALYKISVMYEGMSSEEIMEIEVKNSLEAKKACEELINKNRERIKWLTIWNVYDSKIVKSCSLCPYDFRLDVLAMSDFLESEILKNDI